MEMAEEKKPITVPDWAVKLILGGSAIGVGGYIVYYWVSGGALADAAKKELTYWADEYAREFKKITDEGRIPTETEEWALQKKAERMDDAYAKLASIYDKAPYIVLAAFGIVAGAWLIHKLARDYWDTHVKDVRTPYAGYICLREAIAIDLHAAGNTTLAVALHTQTQTVFQTLYVPMMQAEVAALQAQIPTLVGSQLIWAQFLIQSLQIELAATIPAIMAAAASILAWPPPPIFAT
jgi:hypothetical protein